MRIEKLKVLLVSPSSEASTPGTIEVQSWEAKERLKRALKFGGGCFLAGVVCVIFPLVHFFLVPSLILTSPFVFYWIYSQEKVVLGGQAKCPKCSADFSVARGPYRFPINDVCTACRSAVKITLSE